MANVFSAQLATVTKAVQIVVRVSTISWYLFQPGQAIARFATPSTIASSATKIMLTAVLSVEMDFMSKLMVSVPHATPIALIVRM